MQELKNFQQELETSHRDIPKEEYKKENLAAAVKSIQELLQERVGIDCTVFAFANDENFHETGGQHSVHMTGSLKIQCLMIASMIQSILRAHPMAKFPLSMAVQGALEGEFIESSEDLS